MRHIERVGSEAGIKFNYTNEILMVDNYLPNFKMENEIRKKDSKKIEEKLDNIINDIENRENRLIRKGIGSDLLSKYGRRLADKLSDNYDKKFIVQDNCTGCKVCEKVCPAQNIKVKEKPEFAHKCETCFACIHHCPQNAIHLKSERSKARFINKNVKLKEIIDSNNQGNE